MSRPPLAIDLFCGLGGWTEGLLEEGYRVVGFDIERHHYGEARYPAQLVLQDVLTIHGSQFKSAALIVASPPCQAYSYRAMPWMNANTHTAEMFTAIANALKELALTQRRGTPPEKEDVVCEHGAAMDVHCCGCHSGFLFDSRKCVCF